MFFRLPVIRLSMPITWKPSCRKRSHKCEPRKPAAPVISTRSFSTGFTIFIRVPLAAGFAGATPRFPRPLANFIGLFATMSGTGWDGCVHGLSANADVVVVQVLHLLQVVQVAPVEDRFLLHQLLHALQV